MDRAVALILVLPVLLAGCIGGNEAPEAPPETPEAPAAPPAPLPPPIEESESVPQGADPFNFVTMEPCSQDASACWRYPFTLETRARFSATLTWMTETNDFDLYLYDGEGTRVAMDGRTPPGTEEMVEETLKPDDYEVVVVAWLVNNDTFTLAGTFEHAGGDGNETAGR